MNRVLIGVVWNPDGNGAGTVDRSIFGLWNKSLSRQIPLILLDPWDLEAFHIEFDRFVSQVRPITMNACERIAYSRRDSGQSQTWCSRHVLISEGPGAASTKPRGGRTTSLSGASVLHHASRNSNTGHTKGRSSAQPSCKMYNSQRKGTHQMIILSLGCHALHITPFREFCALFPAICA